MSCITSSFWQIHGIVFRMAQNSQRVTRFFHSQSQLLSIFQCSCRLVQWCYCNVFVLFGNVLVVVVMFNSSSWCKLVFLSLFGVSNPCHYCIPLFINIFNNIRQPMFMLSMLIKGAFKHHTYGDVNNANEAHFELKEI